MKLRIAAVGHSRCSWANDAAKHYHKRLVRYGLLSQETVKQSTFRGNIDAVRHQEGERLLALVRPRDRLVALDERGEALDTPALVTYVDDARQQGVSSLLFVLGGAYGLSRAVRDRAHRVVRLSSLVLNHEVARVVLYEQLYRVMATLHGVPYAH